MAEAGRLDISSDIGEITLALNYLEGQPGLELVDPDGEVISTDDPNVLVQQGDNVQLVTITDPRAGEWIVRVKANNAPQGGVIYNIVVTTQQRPTPTPSPTATETPIPTATPTPTPTPPPTDTPLPTATAIAAVPPTATPVPVPTPTPTPEPSFFAANRALILGTSIGGIVLVLIGGRAAVYFWRVRR